MSNPEPDNDSGVRYEPGETPPPLLSIGLGFQATALILANIVLVSTIVMRAAGETDLYLSWAVWASVMICGLATDIAGNQNWWVRRRLFPPHGWRSCIHRDQHYRVRRRWS